ncbi:MULTISPECIES: putative leader peptide [unclassified Streptomyces]
MAGPRTTTPGTTAPVPLALTLRRHIDLARVSSATCR